MHLVILFILVSAWLLRKSRDIKDNILLWVFFVLWRSSYLVKFVRLLLSLILSFRTSFSWIFILLKWRTFNILLWVFFFCVVEKQLLVKFVRLLLSLIISFQASFARIFILLKWRTLRILGCVRIWKF
jgi:hypothetical protein